ncbi:MAG: NaeI family type II restriction endonuclease [Parasphingorhabdus sp.]
MKKNIPDSIVIDGHADFQLLSAIGAEISERAGGIDSLKLKFADLLRNCIDDVIMTPKTGRRTIEELEKTEKTYIGTRVEIELMATLGLPRGNLDTEILGHDVDIKNTIGSNWMIPTEAVDNICILVAADEKKALCYLGLVVAKMPYLNAGKNKDSKKTISAMGFQNILWLLKHHPYPPNFWRNLAPESVDRIFEGNSGNARVKTLFREIQKTIIDRKVIEATAQQKDFMRRIRADKGKGTRDDLAKEGILLLSGQYDSKLIDAFDLPKCGKSEFISYCPVSVSERLQAIESGFSLQ